jgi:hypothetical protein
MKKLVAALGILLMVGILQAKGNSIFMQVSSAQDAVKQCAKIENYNEFTGCMARVLVPVINSYVNVANRNPQEGKKVAAQLANINWTNKHNALPYNTYTHLPQFLNYSFNVDGMNRAIYGKNYPNAAGEQIALAEPWKIVQKHLACAKNPYEYGCSKPLPALQKVGKDPGKRVAEQLYNGSGVKGEMAWQKH